MIAGKVAAWVRRRTKPKAGTDWRDVAELLLTFPKLKTEKGPVMERLEAMKAEEAVIAGWKEIVAQKIDRPDDDEPF